MALLLYNSELEALFEQTLWCLTIGWILLGATDHPNYTNTPYYYISKTLHPTKHDLKEHTSVAKSQTTQQKPTHNSPFYRYKQNPNTTNRTGNSFPVTPEQQEQKPNNTKYSPPEWVIHALHTQMQQTGQIIDTIYDPYPENDQNSPEHIYWDKQGIRYIPTTLSNLPTPAKMPLDSFVITIPPVKAPYSEIKQLQQYPHYALLLPIASLNTKYWNRQPVQLINLTTKPRFTHNNKPLKHKSKVYLSWFTKGLHLQQDIHFDSETHTIELTKTNKHEILTTPNSVEVHPTMTQRNTINVYNTHEHSMVRIPSPDTHAMLAPHAVLPFGSGGTIKEGTLDCGAMISMLHPKHEQEYEETMTKMQSPIYLNGIGADTKPVKCSYQKTLTIRFGRHVRYMTVAVPEKEANINIPKLLLGMDFLLFHRVILDFSTGQCFLADFPEIKHDLMMNEHPFHLYKPKTHTGENPTEPPKYPQAANPPTQPNEPNKTHPTNMKDPATLEQTKTPLQTRTQQIPHIQLTQLPLKEQNIKLENAVATKDPNEKALTLKMLYKNRKAFAYESTELTPSQPLTKRKFTQST